MVRVVHVISGLFHGGGQRVADDLVTVLQQRTDLDVRLCALGAGAPITAKADNVIPYDGRYNQLSVLLQASRRLRAVLDAGGVDIVHTHGLDADLIGGIATLGRSMRHICHLHITPSASTVESWRAKWRRRLFHHLTSGDRTWFIAVSDAVREQMSQYYRLCSDRVLTVRNGIDVRLFQSSRTEQRRPEHIPIIGTAARLTPMKGLEHLIDAAALLRQRGCKSQLWIAGVGSLHDELHRRAAERGASDVVRFAGQVHDMPGFYRELDMFVLPSVSTEGLPLTVLEAMASGLPVVATSVGGTSEALREGIDGLIVTPGDATALADALQRLIENQSLRRTMGLSGQIRVFQDFSRERMASDTYEVYRRALGTMKTRCECAL